MRASTVPTAPCRVLVEAGQHLVPAEARSEFTVMADSGVENVNADVDASFLAEGLHRVLAQVEVTESNSMIGAWSLANFATRLGRGYVIWGLNWEVRHGGGGRREG